MSKIKEIFLDAPNVGSLEKRYLNRTIEENFVSTVGPFVQEFEEKFAKFINATAAVSTQSGTAALHIALRELGIGPKDEVIVPALTFAATVNPIIYVGAKPVFVDVDINTWNINPFEIERAITKKTKAIIPVHLYGNPCDMDKIMSIARRYNLKVVEDATECIGATYRGRHTGIFGDLGCFSFNGNKIITTGGGGMVVGKNRRIIYHIKFLVNQARDHAKGFYHPEIGFNYRMTNLEAALGLAQMRQLNEFLKKKRRFNEIYKKELKDIDFIRFQKEYPDSRSTNWLTGIIFRKKINLSALQNKLRNEGVPTRRIFLPLVESPPYKKYRAGKLKNSYFIYENALLLPSSTLNSFNDIKNVCDRLRRILGL